ncbi:eRF1 domain 2 domain-containing protein [Ditylenchus destructor]|nr:eRF1 domain 2 domain-containing protein [Ditylenchus destructor]
MDIFQHLLCLVAVVVFFQSGVDSAKGKHPQKKRGAAKDANAAQTEDLDLTPDERVYGFIIISGNGYVIGIKRGLSDQKGEMLKQRKHELQTQHGHGGQSQNRFMRLADEQRDAYLTSVAEAGKEFFIKKNEQTDNYEVTISALIIAGNGQLKDKLSPLLDRRLSNLAKEVLTIEKEKEDGFKEALKSSVDFLKNLQMRREGAAVNEYLETCTTDNEKCVNSANDVAYALGMRCVAKILYLETANYFRYLIKTKDGHVKAYYTTDVEIATCILKTRQWNKTKTDHNSRA